MNCFYSLCKDPIQYVSEGGSFFQKTKNPVAEAKSPIAKPGKEQNPHHKKPGKEQKSHRKKFRSMQTYRLHAPELYSI